MNDPETLVHALNQALTQVQPRYVLVIVTERQGSESKVVHAEWREFAEALALYDGARRIQHNDGEDKA
ncbi:MAG: hypothetical protein ACPLUL_10010 [Thermanaerothrix sp.]|uniref:hypothetical protein n=1 Tax=Thermanaerothrix sp. TaxID=2972675 RepID=UPI003C7A55F4